MAEEQNLTKQNAARTRAQLAKLSSICEPSGIRDLEVAVSPLSALRPYGRNPRTHSKKQIRQIADSIVAFGWTNPILVDAQGGVIAGHGRLEAAKLLGLDTVPTIPIDDLTPAQRRAYVIADNKLAENAGWDDELLALEIKDLLELEIDMTVAGFEVAEIDILLETLDDEEDAADDLPPVDLSTPPVSRAGDLWLLGSHRLLCGDATKAESFAHLMAGEAAQLVFTDPPYNVPIDGHVCGLGAIRHQDFAMASGEMSEAEFIAFLTSVLRHLVAFSLDGSIHFLCMDWRHLFELLTAGRATYSELKNLCVWNKTNGGMGSLYRSKHELVAVFKAGSAPHINNVALGAHGRYRSNVWDYPGVNALHAGRQEALTMHPTVKPVALVADAIKDCSKRGAIVLDAFAGSGTTILAAERTGRIAYTMEIEPRYVDVAIERYRRLTGRDAIHAQLGVAFANLRAQRVTGEMLTEAGHG